MDYTKRFHTQGASIGYPLNSKVAQVLAMTGEVQIRFPLQFSHSVKIGQTAKGARISVHVYSNNQGDVINQAVSMYWKARKMLEQDGQAIAPVESEATLTAETTCFFSFHTLQYSRRSYLCLQMRSCQNRFLSICSMSFLCHLEQVRRGLPHDRDLSSSVRRVDVFGSS